MKNLIVILCWSMAVLFGSCSESGDTASLDFRIALPEVSEISQRGAHVTAQATFDFAEYKNITAGFLYGKASESVATQDREAVGVKSEGKSLSANLTGLNPDEEYRIYAFFRRNGVRVMSDAASFRTLAQQGGGQQEEPEIDVVSDMDLRFAAAGGSDIILYNVYNIEGDDKASALTDAEWISLDDSQSGRVAVTVKANDGAERNAIITLTHPQAAEVRVAVEQAAAGETPKPAEPSFGTPSSSEITASEATVQCSLGYDGEEVISSVCFVYKANGGAEQRMATSNTVGNKSVRLTSLSASTTYTFYLAAEIGGVTYKSASASLTTAAATTPPPADSKARYSGWAELPAEIEKAGDYYYAYHRRADKMSVRNYSVCYSADMRSAVWTAMPIHSSYDGGAGRNDDWDYDPVIPKSVQPRLSSSYKGVYSRGHMVASSDRQVSVATNKQTFYYTNMAPQYQNHFKGGIWQKLENWCWDSQNCSDTLYVVTGAHYANKNKTCSDADGSRVIVPTHFYKILIRSKSGYTGKPLWQLSADEIKCVGFWFEHNESYGTTEKPTSKYMKSVADIEKLTGMTFFPNVPNAPKSSYKASEWGM